MSVHQDLADATFQVIAGNSLGSGFSFMRDNLVVTNLHVVLSCVDLKNQKIIQNVTLLTEKKEKLQAEIFHVDVVHDFALMVIKSHLPTGRKILFPDNNLSLNRGRKLIFSGYPHGVDQLLTSEGIVSSVMDHDQFTIDGMVNGGNSGGPIIDSETGKTLGIVTQRRFILADKHRELTQKIANLRARLAQISSGGDQASIMGIDFIGISSAFSEALDLTCKMLDSNANPGIGIGFPLLPIVKEIERRWP